MKPRDGTGTLPLCSNATSLNDVFIDDVFSDASEVSAPLARIRASNEPRFEVPEHGDLPANVYRRIREELETDGQPSRNLASFVTTSMEDEAEQLALDCMNKNIVNAVEYPQTEAIHQRIIRMIARLFHADLSSVENVQAVGTGAVGIIGTTTVGSSEAVMLALLAHKWNWKNRNTHCRPRSTKDRPYLLIGTHTHVCFAKFARFFDVAVKWVYLQVCQYSITAAQVKTILDTKIIDDAEVMEACGYSRHEAGERRVGELVMAVGCVAGSTFTGDFDDFEGIDRVLTQGDWNIPIHVDAASGGFIIPSLTAIRIPVFLGYSMEFVSSEHRATMSGASEMANGLGFSLVGLGGGHIIAAWGYRPLFLLSAVLTAVGTLTFWLFCRMDESAYTR